jgi:Ca2+-binding RTX toxin-like protein
MILVPNATAQAAPTCQGQPATIEASTGEVTGTPGPDVIVVSGDVTRVDAGAGNDLVCLVETTAIGDEYFGLRVIAGPGDDVVDTAAAGARSYTDPGAGSDTFVGGPSDEGVDLRTEDPGTDTVSTGAGDDAVYFGDSPTGVVGTFDLGVGADLVWVEDDWDIPRSGETKLVIDLVREQMTWRDVTSTVRGAENVHGAARRVVVRGNAAANRVWVMGCVVTLKGRAGDDRLVTKTYGQLDTQPFSCRAKDRKWALGNRGDDELVGGRMHDVLIGGPGTDSAYGGPGGHDRCDAETTRGFGCNPTS